jgi:ubiquinone biosynthesis monooxygenase Coq6
VVSTVKIDESCHEYLKSTAWQKYLGNGPLAMLPLWNNFASIVWSVPNAEAQKLKSISDNEWVDALNVAFRAPNISKVNENINNHSQQQSSPFGFPPFISTLIDSFQGIKSHSKKEWQEAINTVIAGAQIADPLTLPPIVKEVVSSRVSFPLQFQQAKLYSKHRVALVGDAAHSIHPQAGQGLNLSLEDVWCLSNIILENLATGSDYGNSSSLAKYHNERFMSNLVMLSIVDSVHRLFLSESSFPILPNELVAKYKPFIRGLGMISLNTIGGPLKQEMAKFAMGLK